MDLKALEEKYESYQIEMRRHFHRYPEASGEEHDTARKIREELDKMGVEWRVCGMPTGTLATIKARVPVARFFCAATSTRSPLRKKPVCRSRANDPVSCMRAVTTATSRCS